MSGRRPRVQDSPSLPAAILLRRWLIPSFGLGDPRTAVIRPDNPRCPALPYRAGALLLSENFVELMCNIHARFCKEVF